MKMSNGSPKDKPNGRSAPMRVTPPITEIGALDTIFSDWLAGIRRISSFFRKKFRRLPESSGDESRPPPTITQQIYLSYKSECVDRACGDQPPLRRHSNIEPLDQLLGPAAKQLRRKD
jgi:hypothetical protein